MNKIKVEKLFEALSYVIKIGGGMVIFIGLLAFGWIIYINITGIHPDKLLDEIYEKIGTLAEIVGIGAGFIWILRKTLIQFKKQNISFVEPVRELYLLIRKHHIYFGILLLFTAFVHGLYFFLNPDEDIWNNYTGIAAFLSLIPLTLIGWYHKKNKTKKNIKTKETHTTIALIFTILFLIHWAL